jgi:CheY-like chemotaxis protein
MPTPQPTRPRPSVVVADDDAEMRAYIARTLRRHALVHEASDGEEALWLARAVAPCLVVADVRMPGLDGLGLCAALRADPATATVRVLLVSGEAHAATACADGFLAKPFNASGLRAHVERLLAPPPRTQPIPAMPARSCLRPLLTLLATLALTAPAVAQPDAPFAQYDRYVYGECDPYDAPLQRAGHPCGTVPMPSTPTVATSHRAVVAELYAAITRGEVRALAAVLDDDVTWTGLPVEDPLPPRPERRTGRAAVAALLAHLVREPAPVLASEGPDRVIATGRTLRADGAVVPVRATWRLRQGRVVSVEWVAWPSPVASAPLHTTR